MFEYLLELPAELCSECEFQNSELCEEPTILDSKGNVLSKGKGVVSFEECPGKYLHLREYNGSVWRLSDIVAWLFELEEHKKALGAGGQVLFMEYLRLRDLPKMILRTKTMRKPQ